MSKQQNVPRAPYPPMVGSSSIIKSSSKSFGVGNKPDSSVDPNQSSPLKIYSRVSANKSGDGGDKSLKSNGRPFQIKGASVMPPSRAAVHPQNPKRQVPCSRLEFYNTQLYGAINCLDHIISTQGGAEGNDNEELYNSPQNTQGTAAESHQEVGTKTNLSNQSTTINTPSTVASSSVSLFPTKKVGPVLLELRSLDTVGTFQNQRHLQSQTIALCRGISSLGTNVSSTCLSFRSSFSASKQHQNLQHVSKDPSSVDTLQVATGLTTGALCIHTLRNLHNYIPPSATEICDGKSHTWEILDSQKSDDISISYFSHYQPRQHRHASAVAWRPGGVNSNFVAIGLVGSGSGIGAAAAGGGLGGGSSSGAGVGGSVASVGGGISGNASSVVESYRSVGRVAGLGSTGIATTGSDFHSAGYASSKERDYCALIWDVEASSKGIKQSKLLCNAYFVCLVIRMHGFTWEYMQLMVWVISAILFFFYQRRSFVWRTMQE